MAAQTFISIERGLGPEGRVAVVRFVRGDKVNALSPEGMRQLRDAARSFEDDLATSVVILTGTAKAFSAGFDLKDGERKAKAADGLAEQRKSVRVGPSMCRAWAEMEQVTICAIEGFAIGGGAALAVSTDFRILGDGAHMRIPEIALGLNMSWGSIPRILQLIGPTWLRCGVRARCSPTTASRRNRRWPGASSRRWHRTARCWRRR